MMMIPSCHPANSNYAVEFEVQQMTRFVDISDQIGMLNTIHSDAVQVWVQL